MKKETKNLVDFQQRDTEYSYIALSNSEQFLKESAVNFVKETAKQLKMEPYALCGFFDRSVFRRSDFRNDPKRRTKGLLNPERKNK